MTEERLKEIEAQFAKFDAYSGNHILAAFADAYGDRPVRAITDDFRELLTALREAQSHLQESGLQEISTIGQLQEALERAEKAEQERDALRGECALLREALTDAVEFADDAISQLPGWYVTKFHLVEDLSRYKEVLANTSQSAKVAAVLKAAKKWRITYTQCNGDDEKALLDAVYALLEEKETPIDE